MKCHYCGKRLKSKAVRVVIAIGEPWNRTYNRELFCDSKCSGLFYPNLKNPPLGD